MSTNFEVCGPSSSVCFVQPPYGMVSGLVSPGTANLLVGFLEPTETETERGLLAYVGNGGEVLIGVKTQSKGKRCRVGPKVKRSRGSEFSE